MVFGPIFIFYRIKLIFGRLTCFDIKHIVPPLSWSICASFCRNNVTMQKTQFSSGDLLFNKRQKKPFVLLSFIIRIITLISYCCFVSASDQGTERSSCELILFCCDTGSIQGRSFFFLVFLYLFYEPKQLFKNKCAVEAAKSDRLSSRCVEIRIQKICSQRCCFMQN